MKIIYIHQFFKFPDSRGGTRSYDLSREFISNGYSVLVLTTTNVKKNNKRWNVFVKDGIEVHEIFSPYSNNFNKFQRIKSFLYFLFFTTFKLLKTNGNLVLATSTPLTIGIPALIKKWINKTPYIFEVRDVWPEAVIAIGAISNKQIQKILYKLEFVIYKNASQIVPLSTDMQKSIVSRYPQFEKKCAVVIENISEINRFQGSSEKINLDKILRFKHRFSILYAGTFGKVNGLEIAIEWADLIYRIDPSICFIFIGEGTEKVKVTKLAKNKKIFDKNVFIFESITKNELPLWYNSVSMGASFVIDVEELWANSANKFFDTLAAGKPVLINHQGWQADCIKQNEIGYVLPTIPNEKSAKEFVEYTKGKLYQESNKKALKVATEKYSLDVAAEKYLKIIKDV